MVIVRSTQHIWLENGALANLKRIEREVFKCNQLYQ